jgi:hypothetical protein
MCCNQLQDQFGHCVTVLQWRIGNSPKDAGCSMLDARCWIKKEYCFDLIGLNSVNRLDVFALGIT